MATTSSRMDSVERPYGLYADREDAAVFRVDFEFWNDRDRDITLVIAPLLGLSDFAIDRNVSVAHRFQSVMEVFETYRADNTHIVEPVRFVLKI